MPAYLAPGRRPWRRCSYSFRTESSKVQPQPPQTTSTDGAGAQRRRSPRACFRSSAATESVPGDAPLPPTRIPRRKGRASLLSRPRRHPRPENFSPDVAGKKTILPDWTRSAELTAIKPCSRCSRGFYPSHGNQTLCGSCRASRKAASRVFGRVSFGVRRCDYCGREFEAFAAHARFCSQRHCDLARAPVDRKYARPEHRGARRRLAPAVATGRVRCARDAACKRAEYVDGELVGLHPARGGVASRAPGRRIDRGTGARGV